MLDYALRLLSYWSAVRKKVVFFKFGFATGRVWREKNVFLAFLSHILSVFTPTPDLSVPFTARACLLNLGKNTGCFAVYLGCGFA